MNDKRDRIHKILLNTAYLPKHLINHYERDNAAEFLLHSLGHQECFNLAKVAYFIDNPDFNNLQGVAGYHAEVSYKDNHWETPDIFSSHMKETPFNQLVRGISMPSIQKNKKEYVSVAQELAYSLGIEKPSFVSWPVKYENYGLLVFEPHDQDDVEFLNEQLEIGAHLFGFCPIF
jgi:hypothetical protein